VTMTTTSVDEEPPTGGEDAACPTGLAFGDWAEAEFFSVRRVEV